MIEINAGGGAISPAYFLGAKALKWNIKRNVKVNYGKGGQPVSRGFGNTEYTASITLDYASIKAIRDGYQSLTNLGEFDLTITFANPVIEAGETLADSQAIPISSATHSVTLHKCFFNEDGFETEEDDSNITKEFELNPFKISIVS